MCGWCCGGVPVESRGEGHKGCSPECFNAPTPRKVHQYRARAEAAERERDEWKASAQATGLAAVTAADEMAGEIERLRAKVDALTARAEKAETSFAVLRATADAEHEARLSAGGVARQRKIISAEQARVIQSWAARNLDIAQEWDAAHDAFCDRAAACSAHGKPGDRARMYRDDAEETQETDHG